MMIPQIPQLPLLNILERKFNTDVTRPFKDYICIFIQHLLGSNISLIRCFERGGVEKDNLYIVGKAYSSNKDILDYLERNEYHYKNPLQSYSLDICYDEILKKEIRSTVEKVLQSSDSPILLVDDAAKGIGIIHEEAFLQHIYRFKCIELTTRGIRELKKIKIECPVVDVASCFVKRNIESVIIAESMVNEFLYFLDTWKGVYKPRNRQILLCGYGAIGRRICQKLSSKYAITVYDINDEACLQACHDGMNITTNVTDKQYGIIIGCTGLSFNLDKMLIHSGALFVNMSSSDLEFGLWRFNGRKGLMRTKLNAQIEESNLHEFYYVEDGGNIFYIANGGFPIDFTGGIDPIQPEKIQITRSLVFAASFQAISETKRGIINLKADIQEELVDNYFINNNDRI